MTRFRSVFFMLLLVISTSYAANYNISDEASCRALPVLVTWTPPSETPPSDCQIDEDLTLLPGDSLTLLGGVSFRVPSDITLNNIAGTITINFGTRLFQRGTINNQVGGVIVDRGFWDARDNATIVNFASTIEVTNQLQMPSTTLSNTGVFFVNGGSAVITIGNFSTFTNYSSVINDGRIRTAGTLRNNATLTNNRSIEVSGLIENNSSIENNRDIILACSGTYQENGSITGNPVDVPYCINGGDWSDPSDWNQNVLPPSDARIFIESGVSHLDIDFSLTGTMEITAVLEIDSGAQLEILAGGSVTNNNEFITDALIINNHSLINRGDLINEGRIINNADFGNGGLIDRNGVIENHGLFQNTSSFMQNGVDNRAGGIVDNAGMWRMNRSLNTNKGEIRNHSGAEFELNNTLINKSGGFVDNFGVFTVNDTLTNPGNLENDSGGLIINNFLGVLNITATDAALENAGEIRNEGAIGNDGIINNPGRICGAGSIVGNPVNGNIPELICDFDDDSVPNGSDLCPDTAANDSADEFGCSDAQVDRDGDGVCDPGAASDGPSMCTLSPPDNCPDDANPGQEDLDGDNIGDICDDDIDGDGELNDGDNCPLDANSGQEDFDGDGEGDACDDDVDGDTVPNDDDLCPETPLGSAVNADGCTETQVIVRVRDSIQELINNPATSDRARDKLAEARSKLNRALLKFAQGRIKKGFRKLSDTVNALLQARDEGVDVDDLIDELVELARAKAQAAIDAAAGGDANELRKAESKMADALRELAKGRPDQAIARYGDAWQLAEDA